MKKTPFFIWFLLLLFLLNGCNLDSLDFDKLSKEVNLNPEFVAPVAKGNISIWDMIQLANKENDGLITKDQNGLIKIVYKQNNLFNYNVRDFLNFPKQQSFPSEDKILGNISPEDFSISRNVTINDLIGSTNQEFDKLIPLAGMYTPFPPISFSGQIYNFSFGNINDFTNITLSKGSLEVMLENGLPVPITFSGDIFDIQYNRKIGELIFEDIANQSISKKTIYLDNKQISNKLEFRMTSFDTPGSAVPIKIDLNYYFKLTFKLTNLSISKGNLIVKNTQTLEDSKGSYGFEFESGVKAFHAVLQKGSLSVNTSNGSKMTGNIKIVLNNILKNGNVISAVIPLNGNSTNIDLAGVDIDFTKDPTQPYNRIPYTYSLTVNPTSGYVDYSSTDVIKMDVALNNLEFKSVAGDFGKQNISIDPGAFDMNVDILNRLKGSLKLANPKLELIFHNPIGMPSAINLGFSASNKAGSSVILRHNSNDFVEIPYPTKMNETATGSIVFDKGNSNIVDFIALPPTGKIMYMGQVDFNRSNQVITPQNPNFLDLNSTFAIDMAIELPLELQTNNLAFSDTTKISGDNFDKIETADLIINAKNGIPLDVDLQLFFVDTISKKQYGVSKKTKILTAAQVNTSGVITPTQSSNTFSLDKSEMENLRKANGIVFSGTVSSPNTGTTIAPIMSDSKIELNVIIKSKVNL